MADRISAWYRPLLVDSKRPATQPHNLFIPCEGGERSPHEGALEHSLYSDVTLHGGWATKFIVIGLATLGLSLLVRSRRSASH